MLESSLGSEIPVSLECVATTLLDRSGPASGAVLFVGFFIGCYPPLLWGWA